MAEYIEREELIRYTEKQEVIIKDGTSIPDAMRIQGNVFRRCVETCPAADVVEVVRCKDCRRWTPDGGYGLDLDGTKRLYGVCAITNLSHKENHFCSYGAKMDGKGEG